MLQNDLNLLRDRGLLDQTVMPKDDLYVITAMGMLAVKSFTRVEPLLSYA